MALAVCVSGTPALDRPAIRRHPTPSHPREGGPAGRTHGRQAHRYGEASDAAHVPPLCRFPDYAERSVMDRQGAVLQRLRQTLLVLTPGLVFPPLQALEKGQKLIIWPITSRRTIGRRGLGQDFLLQREVRLEVDLRGFDRFMPEPQCDDGSIHPSL